MPENALNRLKSFAEDIFNNRTRLLRILLIVLILMLAFVLRLHENSKADITVDSAGDAGRSELCVDIGGAVVSPGVYTVKPHTRLYEVIEMAGGLLSNADTDSINRAEYVEDGEKIIVPERYQIDASQYSDDGISEGSSVPDEQGGGSSESAGAAAAASTGSTLVNINYASREELMTLPGIGEAKADSIIEYRSGSRFRKKEDIKSVNGIGDSIYNKIKDYITV